MVLSYGVIVSTSRGLRVKVKVAGAPPFCWMLPLGSWVAMAASGGNVLGVGGCLCLLEDWCNRVAAIRNREMAGWLVEVCVKWAPSAGSKRAAEVPCQIT